MPPLSTQERLLLKLDLASAFYVYEFAMFVIGFSTNVGTIFSLFSERFKKVLFFCLADNNKVQLKLFRFPCGIAS